MTVSKQDTPPLSGSIGDVWVDTSNGDQIYSCESEYHSSAIEKTLTVNGFAGTPITFKTASPHAPSLLRIVNGGASGSASLSRSGDGSSTSPYIYTFTLFSNSSSNDTMISLVGTQPLLTAEGSDANHAAVIPTTEDLPFTDNVKNTHWLLRSIWAKFVAAPPQLFATDLDMPHYIPPMLQNVLAEAAAIRLGSMDGGGDLARARIWEDRIGRAISTVRKSMNGNTNTKQTRRYF